MKTRLASVFWLLLPVTAQLWAAEPAATPWHFAVSGDSRNCGDVIMPAIAAGVLHDGAHFYWHLGDFRVVYDFDDDILAAARNARRPRILDYENHAWDDFIENQLDPFGTTPVFLGIGNHETIPPKTRNDFLIQFADWLDSSVLRAQRLSDNARDHRLKTYYHWMEGGIDFINLDNASNDQFDNDQLRWLEKRLQLDEADAAVRAIVVGMHAALPESISGNHSMGDGAQGDASGRRVYADLLHARDQAGKQVYILSSHSHFFLDGAYNTQYWREHGGVLPGWTIGTAGAIRYKKPPHAEDANQVQTGVYGYLIASVDPSAKGQDFIRFSFHEVKENDVPAATADKYSAAFVHQCFAENMVP